MSKYEMYRDPEILDERLPKTQSLIFLGLDLGTNCGMTVAYHKPGAAVDPTRLELYLGQLDLSAGAYDSGAIRFVRLRQFLSIIKPDLVAYEQVRYTPAEKVTRYNAGMILARAATSMEWFGALKGTLCCWCEENNIPCTGFPIQTIKRRLTSKGNASKIDMIKSCNALIGTDFDPETYEQTGADNVVDSFGVCLLALEEYGKGLPNPKEISNVVQGG